MHAQLIHTFSNQHLFNFNQIQTMPGKFCTNYTPDMCISCKNLTSVFSFQFKCKDEGKNTGCDKRSCRKPHVMARQNTNHVVKSQRAAMHTSCSSTKEIKQKKRNKLRLSWPCINFNAAIVSECYSGSAPHHPPSPRTASLKRLMKKILSANKNYICTRSSPTKKKKRLHQINDEVTDIIHGMPATAVFAVRAEKATQLQPRNSFAEISHGAIATTLFTLVLRA